MDLHMEAAAPESVDCVDADVGDEQQQGHDLQQQQAEDEAAQQQQPQLTELVQLGLESMASRKQQIHQAIDELSQVAVNFLEQTKMSFLQAMERHKQELDGYCEEQELNNMAQSAATLEAYSRLRRAQQLVQSLGLETMNTPHGQGEHMMG